MPVIESVEAVRDGFVLKLESGLVFDVGTAYLPPEYAGAFLRPDAGEGFSPGAELGPEAEAALRFAAECFAAEKAALRLVARAEQCEAGLGFKLERRGYGSAPVRAVLSRLMELNLVNDERYAGLWLKYRVSHGVTGPRALSARIQAKGIDRKTAAAALDSVLTAEAEAALLRRCAVKAGFAAGTAAGRGGELRYFLKGEGFSQAAIDGFIDAVTSPMP